MPHFTKSKKTELIQKIIQTANQILAEINLIIFLKKKNTEFKSTISHFVNNTYTEKMNSIESVIFPD